ncbi:MAG: hypothetical protein AB8H79_11060 [Myxococcota bacterium]
MPQRRRILSDPAQDHLHRATRTGRAEALGLVTQQRPFHDPQQVGVQRLNRREFALWPSVIVELEFTSYRVAQVFQDSANWTR